MNSVEQPLSSAASNSTRRVPSADAMSARGEAVCRAGIRYILSAQASFLDMSNGASTKIIRCAGFGE